MPVVVELDADELEHLARELDLDRKAMERAVRVAAGRTARWARTQISRGLASRLGLPAKLLAGKRLTAKSGRSGARVWVALNPVNAARAGAEKTAHGLRAAGRDFFGAFSLKSKHGGRAAVRRAGRARTPLEAASFDVVSAAPEEINGKAWPALNERFLAFYGEELERRASR